MIVLTIICALVTLFYIWLTIVAFNVWAFLAVVAWAANTVLNWNTWRERR